MHACGHDGITAVVLGLAKLLSENKDKLNNDLASISKYKNDIVDNRIKYRKVISDVADEYSSTVKNVKTSFSNNVGEV